MTRFAVEELIIIPESIQENNFTEKGTIIQFHKTTSPIPTHDTDTRKNAQPRKVSSHSLEHDKVNDIGSMKLLHHRSTDQHSKIKVQDYNWLQKNCCQRSHYKRSL